MIGNLKVNYKDTLYNKISYQFQRYKHEIELESYDAIQSISTPLIHQIFKQFGESEIQYLVKEFYIMVLNALFFENPKLLFNYQKWVYRVYFHRDLDLEFFKLLFEKIQDQSHRYIDEDSITILDSLFSQVYSNHEICKKSAHYKKTLFENQEAEEISNLLIEKDIQKLEEIFHKNSPDLEKFVHFYSQKISKAMHNIGYMWENNLIHFSKEHIATQTLKELLLQTLQHIQEKPANNKHIFLSIAPNEMHSFGLEIAKLVYEKLGFKVTTLTENLSNETILYAIQKFQPEIVLISATLSRSLIDMFLLISEINTYKSTLSNNLKVGIAGAAFETFPLPTKTMHADFYIRNIEHILENKDF